MHLEIPTEVEATLRDKARAEGFETVEQYVLSLTGLEEPVPEAPRDEWQRKFEALVARQKSRNPSLDDRRESTYPVR